MVVSELTSIDVNGSQWVNTNPAYSQIEQPERAVSSDLMDEFEMSPQSLASLVLVALHLNVLHMQRSPLYELLYSLIIFSPPDDPACCCFLLLTGESRWQRAETAPSSSVWRLCGYEWCGHIVSSTRSSLLKSWKQTNRIFESIADRLRWGFVRPLTQKGSECIMLESSECDEQELVHGPCVGSGQHRAINSCCDCDRHADPHWLIYMLWFITWQVNRLVKPIHVSVLSESAEGLFFTCRTGSG